MLKETAMVSVVLALLLLNIIAPTLLGHQESDISAIPLMLLDADSEEMQIYIKGALSDHRYTSISILVQGIDNESYLKYVEENESYVTKQRVLLNETSNLRMNVNAYVEQDEWWFNCTARIEEIDGDVVFWISSEDDDGSWGTEELEETPFRQRLNLRRG